MLPGHEINLEIHCEGEPEPEITDVEWKLPGIVFKNYVTQEQSGTLTPLQASDLDGTTVKFHWADVGEGRAVRVHFKADGESCCVEETFNVKDPIVEYGNNNPPHIGEPRRYPALVELRNAEGPGSQGIYHRAKVKIPAGLGFAAGEWYFGQLIHATRFQKRASNQQCKKRDTGGFVNDDPWPYITGAHPSPPPWSTGDTLSRVYDSPGQYFKDGDGNNLDQIVGKTGIWHMYIMFKPANDPPGAGESKYVPLRKQVWETTWCAEDTGTGWILVTADEDSGSWAVERVHPQWTEYFGNVDFEACACPPACE